MDQDHHYTLYFQQTLPKDCSGNNNTTALQKELGLIAPTTVAGTLYGVAFALYCLYVQSLAPQLRNHDAKRRARCMLGYSTIVMLCGLYSLVTNAWVTQEAYINHIDYAGDLCQYIFSTCHTEPVITVGIISQMMVDVLTSAIQIWRVWVIWSSTRYAKLVILLPLLSFLTFTGLQLRTIILRTILPMSEDGQRDTQTIRAVGILIQGATTIFSTMLISLFLMYMRRQQRNLLGGTGSALYMNIVAILVESYAMESMWLFIVALSVAFDFPAGLFFGETKTYIEIIAYLLVLCRVVSGKAYGSERPYILSSLKWNASVRGTGDGTLWSGKSETGDLPVSMA